ncbi:MAG: CRTAC1 family protein [Thermoanaerobaculia bacterium]
MPTSIGSGAAWLDYDLDGDLDIFLVHGARGGDRFLDGEPWPCRLLRQEGDGTFVDVTALAGLSRPSLGMGVAVGDIDGDGDPDLYVTNYGPDALFDNNGDGSFTDVSRAAGVDNPSWGSSALFFDYDRDGDQDLYVTNYVDFDPAVVCTDNGGRPDYCGPAGSPGVADVLYRNDGGGRSGAPTFTDVSARTGIAAAPAPGLGVVSADFDGDLAPDLYVANDGTANQLWINRGDGTFDDRAADLGTALNALARSEAGMGIALGDVEEDSDWDLFITHLKGETNTFYQRVGSHFHDQTLAAGLAGVSVPYTGFGTGFVDFDLDGDLDLAVVNGRVTRGARWAGGAAAGYWDDYSEPNLLFENDGDGRFRDVSEAAGAWFAPPETGRGLALGDFDRNGHIDLLATSAGGGARLFRNRGPSSGSWLSVRVLDAPGRSDSLGAEVTAVVGRRRLERLVAPGSGFLSSSEARVHFGLGAATAVDLLIVRWLDGGSARFSHLPAGRRIHVIRQRPARRGGADRHRPRSRR